MTAETEAGLRSSPWLFLLGAVVFLGSAGLFLYDLVNGNDVVRGLVANGLAAALVLALAGHETRSNPTSSIRTRAEAVRAVLFFYGIYLLLAGGVVLVTAVLAHPDPQIGGVSVGVGGAITVVTFLTGGEETTVSDRLSTLVGLLGLVLVAGSAVLFLYDLATGRDVLWGIAANGVGAALFVLWTAYDMPADPASEVQTHADALGVALLFYGAYLLVAGAVVAVTGVLAHARGGIGLMYLVLGAVTLVLGLFLAPRDALESSTDEGPGASEETS